MSKSKNRIPPPPPSDKSIERILELLWQTPQEFFPISKDYLLKNGIFEAEISHFFSNNPKISKANFDFCKNASIKFDKMAQKAVEGENIKKTKTPTCGAMLIGDIFPNVEMIYAELRKHGWSNEELANQWKEIMAIAADKFAETQFLEAAE